jgi:hypothetical protein
LATVAAGSENTREPASSSKPLWLIDGSSQISDDYRENAWNDHRDISLGS